MSFSKNTLYCYKTPFPLPEYRYSAAGRYLGPLWACPYCCGSSSGPLLTLPSSPVLFQPSLRPHTLAGRVPRPRLVSLHSVLSSSYPSGPCTLKPNHIPERAIRTFAFTLGKHCYSRLQDSCTSFQILWTEKIHKKNNNHNYMLGLQGHHREPKECWGVWKWEPSLEGTSPSHHEYKSVLLASGSFLNLEIQTCPLKPSSWSPCCFYWQPELRSSLFFLRSLNDSGTGLLGHAKATTHTHNRCSPQTTRVLSIVRSSPEMPQLGLQ